MDEIKSWGMMLVFISAGCVIYFFLLPAGNISKTAKSISSIVILALICVPVFNTFFEFDKKDFKKYDIPSFSDDYDIIANSTKKAINELISNVVKQHTSTKYATDIEIDIDNDNTVNIRKITIIFDNEIKAKLQLQEKLFEVLLLMPEIEVKNR